MAAQDEDRDDREQDQHETDGGAEGQIADAEELLLDIENCNIRETARDNVIQRYQKAVQRQMQKGAATPMKLSEFLSKMR